MDQPKIDLLAEWMKESRRTVILTGAGMSTESGIPDFRSKEGWWKKIDPMTVSTVDALEHQYDLFHGFYSLRLSDLKKCEPHKGHEALADLEKEGHISAVVTQNVDGFHQQSGSGTVHELHGSLRKIFCHECGARADEAAFLEHKSCSNCEGHLRPDIILFGEMLPQDVWGRAIKDIEESDLLIVIGSSLQVAPANELPFLSDGKRVIINQEETYLHNQFDLQIAEKAGEVLQLIRDKVLEGTV